MFLCIRIYNTSQVLEYLKEKKQRLTLITDITEECVLREPDVDFVSIPVCVDSRERKAGTTVKEFRDSIG